MAATKPWLLPSPFVAQVLHTAAINDVKDFSCAKQVCRSWRDVANGDEFRFYQKLLECVDASEVQDTGCFFESYKDDNWFCYWDRDSEVPQDPDDHYVFRPLPVGTKAGFVTMPNANILGGGSPQLTLESIESLLDLGKELLRIQARTGMGNESDSYLTPIILPWDSGEDPTPETVLAAMGANPAFLLGSGLYRLDFSKPRHYLRLGVIFDDDEFSSDDASGEGDGLQEAGKVCRRFREFMFERGEPLIFYAGSELLNPLPMFYLRKLTERLVGGFVGSLIHT